MEDFAFGFVFGIIITIVIMGASFTVGTEIWANNRNKFMEQCTQQNTYESCYAQWSGAQVSAPLVRKDAQ